VNRLIAAYARQRCCRTQFVRSCVSSISLRSGPIFREHAVVENDELCLSSAEAPRKESREGFLYVLEKPGPRRLGWCLFGQ
jgi:hypothetical protein